MAKPPPFEEMLRTWRTKAKPNGEGLGQFFVTRYLDRPFDALMAETDTNKAMAKIKEIYNLMRWG